MASSVTVQPGGKRKAGKDVIRKPKPKRQRVIAVQNYSNHRQIGIVAAFAKAGRKPVVKDVVQQKDELDHDLQACDGVVRVLMREKRTRALEDDVFRFMRHGTINEHSTLQSRLLLDRVYLTDTARACVEILGAFGIYSVGGGRHHNILHILTMMCRLPRGLLEAYDRYDVVGTLPFFTRFLYRAPCVAEALLDLPENLAPDFSETDDNGFCPLDHALRWVDAINPSAVRKLIEKTVFIRGDSATRHLLMVRGVTEPKVASRLACCLPMLLDLAVQDDGCGMEFINLTDGKVSVWSPNLCDSDLVQKNLTAALVRTTLRVRAYCLDIRGALDYGGFYLLAPLRRLVEEYVLDPECALEFEKTRSWRAPWSPCV
jgi:hypothetical protein